ncbi:MAG TPA: TonB-dependent receptor [Thermoanaerobaculia bacterium]|nr:TonB-dependent receptor [Thermoanaerobaculia bacterium]
MNARGNVSIPIGLAGRRLVRWWVLAPALSGLALVALIIALCAAPRAAAAQEPPPETPKADQTKDQTAEPQPEVVTEEITVTARKREEGIQEVPFSVAAPTEEALRNRGASDIEGVAANVAGFSVQNLGPGQSQVAMRGVSAGQIVRDQPGVKEQVGIYLDESVISLSLFTPDLDLFDVSRVEVLRGPQGTLFGSGSESGTVRYISNQPKLGLSEALGEFSFDSIGQGGLGGSVKAAVNAPIGQNSAMRLAAYRTNMGGFVDAVQPGLRVKKDVNSGDRTGVRWALRTQPNDRLSITPRVVYQELKTDGWNRADAYNILGNPFTTTRPAVHLGEREQFTQFEEPFSDKFLLADVNLDYKLGSGVLTSVTSYTDRDILVVRDATALTASITGGSIGLPERVYSLDAPLDDATKVKILTQELRLSGKSDSLDWLGGVFYSNVDRKYAQSLLVAGFEDLSGIPTRGLRAPKDVLFFSDLKYQLDQFAVFGETTYKVNDRFDLTGGLRYYNFNEDRTQVFDGIFGNDNNGTSLVSTKGSTDADGLAPRLIGSYKISDKTSLNAQVSKGFRLGGINDPLNVPLCTPQDLRTFGGHDNWKDETLWNYEVGSKSSVLGGRGVVNVAAFYTNIDDLQATVTAGSCSSRVIFNVPKARSRGLELETSAAVNANFDFSFSASYADSELLSTLTSTDASGNVSVVSGIKKGNRLPSVPKLQVAAAATYQRPFKADWLGYLTGTYQHVGSRFTQVGDQAAGFGTVNLRAFPGTIGGPLTASTFTFDPELPAYDIANLRFGVAHGRFDVALFVNNLTDERALLALDQERGTLARVGFLINQPRTFGINTRIQFK